VSVRTWAWIGGSGAVSLGLTAALVLSLSGGGEPPPWGGPVVPALVQTADAYGQRDTADDPAIWVSGRGDVASLVIGSNKGEPGGLQVFDLDGTERLFADTGALNNVDLRDGFPFVDGLGTLVAATNRTTDTITFFRLHPDGPRLEHLGDVDPGMPDVYGFCLHHDRETGRFHAIVTDEVDTVRQFELLAGGDVPSVRALRSWQLTSEAEGCVADDEHDRVFVTQEAEGLWTFTASPDGPNDLELVVGTSVTGETPLVADVEGVAIYDAGAGEGYLVVSSQGSSTLAVFDRERPHGYLGSFAVGPGDGVDGASNTDGVAVTSAAVDPRFPEGLLVVHDQHNRGGDTSNFKYVSWRDVAEVLDLPAPGHVAAASSDRSGASG
jgi:3-phytase